MRCVLQQRAIDPAHRTPPSAPVFSSHTAASSFYCRFSFLAQKETSWLVARVCPRVHHSVNHSKREININNI